MRNRKTHQLTIVSIKCLLCARHGAEHMMWAGQLEVGAVTAIWKGHCKRQCQGGVTCQGHTTSQGPDAGSSPRGCVCGHCTVLPNLLVWLAERTAPRCQQWMT